MTDMMTLNDQAIEAVAGGEISGNLPDSILYQMSSYERYTYFELYSRLNDAIEAKDIRSQRFYYGEAMSWEQQMKRKYY